MKFNLFALDIPDEAIDAFKQLGAAVIITGSALGDDYAIVPTETFKYHKMVCYTPEECRYLYGISDKEAKKVHAMKKAFGGSVVPVQ